MDTYAFVNFMSACFGKERFTDLVTGMFVVNYPCSSGSRTDVLLE